MKTVTAMIAACLMVLPTLASVPGRPIASAARADGAHISPVSATGSVAAFSDKGLAASASTCALQKGQSLTLIQGIHTREEPSFSSPLKYYVPQGHVVLIIDTRSAEGATWYRLDDSANGGGVGWFADTDNPWVCTPPPPPPSPPPCPLQVGQRLLLTQNLYTRDGPSVSSHLQWFVPRGHTVIITDTLAVDGATWYKLDDTANGGGVGWFADEDNIWLCRQPIARQLHGAHMFRSNDAIRNSRQIALAKGLGAQVVRVDLSWRLLETKRGQFATWYLDNVDALVAQARAQGISIIFMFAQSPCWAIDRPGCDPSYQWYPPQNPADYASALAYLVRRYGHCGARHGACTRGYRSIVLAWEVWNEPDWGESRLDPTTYARLLIAAYGATKRADTGATILGGSLAGADVAYLDALYAAGARGHFDGLALHPYSGSRSPADTSDPRWSYQGGVDDIRTVLQRHGGAPIWITEIGWSTSSAAGLSEIEQAAYLEQAVAIAGQWGDVPAVVWYDLAGPNDTAPDDGFSLVDGQLHWKQAANQFQDWMTTYGS